MCLPCLASEAGWVCLYCPTEGALEGTGLESNQTAGQDTAQLCLLLCVLGQVSSPSEPCPCPAKWEHLDACLLGVL